MLNPRLEFPFLRMVNQGNRRHFLITASLLGLIALAGISPIKAAENPSPVNFRQKLNFNADWRFLRADAPGAEKPEFDAASWTTVSCPHTWNDVDSFDNFATGGHQGESELWKGTAWYRKEFTLPLSASGRKVFIEFEGVRQIVDIYLNGSHLVRDKTGSREIRPPSDSPDWGMKVHPMGGWTADQSRYTLRLSENCSAT